MNRRELRRELRCEEGRRQRADRMGASIRRTTERGWRSEMRGPDVGSWDGPSSGEHRDDGHHHDHQVDQDDDREEYV